MSTRTNRSRKQSATRPFVKAELKSYNQKVYMDSIFNNDYTIGIGCAGVGKTYLAAGVAAELLHEKEVKKIILTRPCIAAESIGFLPGDGEQKVLPYLAPLFEELGYFMNVENGIKAKQIYIEPLAFLRGRTIKDSVIILDEAQNCTFSQLVMTATRLGEGSLMIINGDLTQSDLQPDRHGRGGSGLAEFVRKVSKCSEDVCKVCYFDKNDLVRHESVKAILEALEKE